ncbi:hypothetical protein LTR12_010430 [Friedmanniomyces endolithicus]|nr:hypothetical protein LTR12_010430 [Friedmanniomyces endolithicus]
MATLTLSPPTTTPTARTCPCKSGGYSALPCCLKLQTAHTRTFLLLLAQIRAEARALTVPPPPSRTPTLVTPPKEGYLFHLEGQNLVAAFDRACVEGGCVRGERAALYQACVLRGGLREVVEAQEAKVRRGHERAKGVVREEKEVRKQVEMMGSVNLGWEGSASGAMVNGMFGGGMAGASFEGAMAGSRDAVMVRSWVATMAGPCDWAVAGAVLDGPITGVELDRSTVGVLIDWPVAGVSFDGATTDVVVTEASHQQTACASYADMARRAAPAGF